MSSKTILEILIIGIVAMIIAIIILPTHHSQINLQQPSTTLGVSPQDGFTNGVSAFKAGDYLLSIDKSSVEFVGILNKVYIENNNVYIDIKFGKNDKRTQKLAIISSVINQFPLKRQKTIDIFPPTRLTQLDYLTIDNVVSVLGKSENKPLLLLLYQTIPNDPTSPTGNLLRKDYLPCNQKFTIALGSSQKYVSCIPMVSQVAVYENF